MNPAMVIVYYSLCLMSVGPVRSYTCPVSGTKVEITQNISCQDVGIHLLVCRKGSGQCAQLHPTYIGECGDGVGSSFTHRLAGHLGTAKDRAQGDTIKPVGHQPDRDMLMIPIEKIPDNFTRKARESFYIEKFQSLKRLGVTEVEHGLNLSRGQTV